jgi:hypothetical protein
MNIELIETFQCEDDLLKGKIRIEINNQSCWIEYQEAQASENFDGHMINDVNLINLDFAEQVAFKILEAVQAARSNQPLTTNE